MHTSPASSDDAPLIDTLRGFCNIVERPTLCEMMTDDPKSIVATGYDLIAEGYLERYGRSLVRDQWLGKFITLLPAKSRVLDLGCGSGVPVARELARRGHDVVGIDGSAHQVSLARLNASNAHFIHGDMTRVEVGPSSFDAVAAFYSITHVPRDEHADLLLRIASWLKPGGIFLASLGADQSPGWRGSWLGVEMFFSHYGAEANKQLVRQAGFDIEEAAVVNQDNEDGRFLWVASRLIA
jgi:SAM-dependent methyltransferase